MNIKEPFAVSSADRRDGLTLRRKEKGGTVDGGNVKEGAIQMSKSRAKAPLGPKCVNITEQYITVIFGRKGTKLMKGIMTFTKKGEGERYVSDEPKLFEGDPTEDEKKRLAKAAWDFVDRAMNDMHEHLADREPLVGKISYSLDDGEIESLERMFKQ